MQVADPQTWLGTIRTRSPTTGLLAQREIDHAMLLVQPFDHGILIAQISPYPSK